MSAPTILDVAALAGVSRSSVSRVVRGSTAVSDECREAVLRAIKELNYQPNAAARTLVRRRSSAIGVLVTDFHNPFFQDVLDGIDSIIGSGEYTPLVVSGKRIGNTEETALHRLLELRVDGIVCVSATLTRRALMDAARLTPLVTLSRTPELPRVDSVVNDDREGASLAVRHLIDLGHRDIAIIASQHERSGLDRIRGYEETLLEAGLSRNHHIVPGGVTEADGYTGARQVLERCPNVTAIFAGNDMSALGVLDAAEDVGLDVPRDLSVIGYDNTSTASLRRIDLTTIDQSAHEIGATAMDALLKRIEDPSRSARRIVIPPILRDRSTSGPAPKRARRA